MRDSRESTRVEGDAPVADRIRREARVVGLRDLDVPTLEDVEQRRLQLWIVMMVLVVGVSGAMGLALLWRDGEEAVLSWLPPMATRLGILGLTIGFCAYAIEKELHLRRLTHLLLEERVVITALANRLDEMTALLDAGRAMNAVLELEEVLERILDNAIELLGGAHGSVLLLDDDEVLRSVCARGNEHAVHVVLRVGEGIAGQVAASREPLLISGEVSEGAYPGRGRREHPVVSAMSAPLIHRDTLLGVLNVNAADGRTFTEYDLRALSLFGEHAASAIANARLYEAERSNAATMAHQAFHDPLTGLANRSLFADRVGHALDRARQNRSRLAVLFVDLDDFKRINDSLGHAFGDRLLSAVADRIRRTLRHVDTAARLGGDEFAILIEDLADSGDAVAAAERLVDALALPLAVGGRSVTVRGSIGVALDEAGSARVDELLRNADVAMYLAKGNGKSCVRVFEDSMHTHVMERLELESALEGALERAELALRYQPIVEVATGRITGFEALVRWDHEELGHLLPDAFIPLAEETGLIVGIDRWVLLHACRQGRVWQDAFPDIPLLVGVNLSTRQLESDLVVEMVELALEVSGLPPERLVIEITESFVLQDERASARRLEALRALGVRLAIDDFGTGYASLSYLKRLPVDVLKIDRSFTDGLGRVAEDAALVKAIVRLAQSLGLDVVAEGVERQDQLDALSALSCPHAQGWYFSKPLEAAAMQALLEEQTATIRAAVTPPVLSAGSASPQEYSASISSAYLA